MRKFWGFYDNGTYRVGCNGATIYVYDQENRELGKFRDISYAYCGAFQPGTNIFVAKSTEGALAVYDLDSLILLKKIRITRIGAQDEGFAFSLDGNYFYNIEKPDLSTDTQLTIYRTTDYEAERVLFLEDNKMVLDELEFDEHTGDCYVLGFMRGADGVIAYGFIGRFIGDIIIDIKKMSYEAFHYVSEYKDWERSGFTSRNLEWSGLKDYSEHPSISLKQAYERMKDKKKAEKNTR